MPKLKKTSYMASNKAGATEKIDVEIHVAADGRFYAHVPEFLRPATANSVIDHRGSKVAGRFKVTSPTLDELDRIIQSALNDFVTPDVSEEPVIRYNIESHVSFAQDSDGNIFPNAGFPGAEWDGDITVRRMYGDHHATHPAKGGYSVVVGARAMLKRTYRFGDKTKVEYEFYNKGQSRLGHENPAQLLNSWVAQDLGPSPKEIPYTDEAALFFHSMLLGMATLCKRIQEATFDQQKLLEAIASRSGIPLLQSKS